MPDTPTPPVPPEDTPRSRFDPEAIGRAADELIRQMAEDRARRDERARTGPVFHTDPLPPVGTLLPEAPLSGFSKGMIADLSLGQDVPPRLYERELTHNDLIGLHPGPAVPAIVTTCCQGTNLAPHRPDCPDGRYVAPPPRPEELSPADYRAAADLAVAAGCTVRAAAYALHSRRLAAQADLNAAADLARTSAYSLTEALTALRAARDQSDLEKLQLAVRALLDLIGEDSFCDCPACRDDQPAREAAIAAVRALVAS